MLIYLYGSDEYSRKQEIDRYVRGFIKKHADLSLRRFDCREEGALQNLSTFVSDQSLFSRAKLGILHNTDAVPGKDLAGLLKEIHTNKDTTIIISADKKSIDGLTAVIAKAFTIKEFPRLSEETFARFLSREAEKRGVSLSKTDRDTLLRLHASDTWGLVNELDKLSLGGRVEQSADVGEFFPLLMKAKNAPIAAIRLSAMTKLLEREDAPKLFNILASQVGIDEKKIMADYDVAIKSGKLEYEEALTDFVLR